MRKKNLISTPTTPLAERLRCRMQEAGLNARNIAQQASVGPSFVYDILKGKSVNPTTHKLAAVAEVLGVSVPYLVNGEKDDKLYMRQECIAVPYIEVADGEITDNNTRISYIHKSWVGKLSASAGKLRMLDIKGDAMKPNLLAGDAIMVDTADTLPSPCGLFALFDGIAIVTRRVEAILSAPPQRVQLIPDNPQYNTQETLLANLQIIGRVVWMSRQI